MIEIKTQQELDDLCKRTVLAGEEYSITGQDLKLNYLLSVYGYLFVEKNTFLNASSYHIESRFFGSIEGWLNPIEVYAYDNSKVKARDSIIYAYGDSTVESYGGVSFSYDRSTVEAHDNTIVSAYNDSLVLASDDSRIISYENSKVKAGGLSVVCAEGNSTIDAHDKSCIYARGESRVDAFGSSFVSAYQRSTIFLWAMSRIQFPDESYRGEFNDLREKRCQSCCRLCPHEGE